MNALAELWVIAGLYRRWGLAPRSRPAGAGFKPPQAAKVKSLRGERCWKRRKLFRQVSFEETNASEPLMTCRNVFNRRRNRDLDFCPASKGWGTPADHPTGVRHEGGVTSRQASVRNTGTCRPDAKPGEDQDRLLQGCQSPRGIPGTIIRLSRLHISVKIGDWPKPKALYQLHPRGQ